MISGDLITVLTLTYRNYDDIFRTIDSVLIQDYQNIEYIISDDGCEYFPKGKIEEYINNKKKPNFKNIIVRCNETNYGTVRHENIVCNIAHGKYIIEVSGGDELCSEHIVSDIVECIGESESDIIVTRRIVCDEMGRNLYYLPHLIDINRINRFKTNKSQYEAFISGKFYDMASGSAMVYRTEFIRNFKFDEHYKLLEDYPLFTRYTWMKKIECHYEIVAIKYYLGGISNSGNSLMKIEMDIYNTKDRIAHIKEVSWLTREKVNYQLKRSKGINVFFLLTRFPIVCIYNLTYYFTRKIAVIHDKYMIKKEEMICR